MTENNKIYFQLLESVNDNINQLYSIEKSQREDQTINCELKVNNSIGLLKFSYENSSNRFVIQTMQSHVSNQVDHLEDIILTQGTTLVTFIETQQQLSLIQIFLWKYKQNYFLLDQKLKFIFIQANFETKDMTQLWSNLGCLSAHIGFEVQSIDHQQQFRFHDNIQIYYQSQYPSFDTLKIIDKDFRFSVEIVNDILLYQILLTKLALFYKKDYAHILPIILALNAITLEQNIQQNGQQLQLLEYMVTQTQYVYDDYLIIPEGFINVFHLPLHLIQLFYNKNNNKEQKENCLIEFQQICDISYYNKVEYMCLARNFYRNENSVMSFSSRSGKSTTLYSLYYYDLFSKKSVPVYINLTPEAGDQPLYNRYSFLFDIDNISFKGSGVVYFENYYKQVNKILNNINISSLWAQNCLQCLFTEINVKNVLSPEVKLQNKMYQQLTVIDIFNRLLQMQLFQEQQPSKIKTDTYTLKLNKLFNQWFIQKINLKKKSYQTSINKNINLYIDECLSKQQFNYKKCISTVSHQCELFMIQLFKLTQNSSTFGQIFKITKNDINFSGKTEEIKDQHIKKWIEIFSYKYNYTILEYIGNKQSIIDYFDSQNNFIKTEATQEQKQFILLKYWYVYYNDFISTENSQISFIDNFIIESPQFPNIKKRKDILFHLLEQIYKLKYDQFQEQLENVLFQFFMSLYNPRGIETMFWKNIQYYISNVLDEKKRRKSYYYYKQQYFGKQIINNSDEYIDLVSLNQDEHINKSENVKNRILVAGTDFSLINFVRQNQLCYNTESSRLLQDYTQTSIVSPAQPHPQILDEFYYTMQRVSMSNVGTYREQIITSIQRLDFHQYYVHMLPEKASEMQILCALISPQIMFNISSDTAEPFLLNQSQKFSSIRSINNMSTNLDSLQMYHYKQISNQIIIKRCKNNQIYENSRETSYDNIELFKNKILYHTFDIKKFHENIVFIPSTIYNKEITILFNYEITQKFFNNKISHKLSTYVNDEQKLFSWNSLNECNSILLFVLTLTCNNAVHNFKIIRDQTRQKLFISMHQVINSQLQSFPTQDLWRNMQQICGGMKFMFLQQSYDEYMHGSSKQRKQNVYLSQSTDYAIEAFKILINNGIFLHLQQIKRDNEQLVIISVIDKQLLNSTFPISDYMLTIISYQENLFDDFLFEKTSFTHKQNGKEYSYFVYQIFIEYGAHFNKDLGRKIYDTSFKAIIQLGFIDKGVKLNNLDFPLQQYQVKTCNDFEMKSNNLPNEYLLKDLQDFNENIGTEQKKQVISQWIQDQDYLINYINIFHKIKLDQQILQNIDTQLFTHTYIEEQLQSIIKMYEQSKLPVVIQNIVTKKQVYLDCKPTFSLIINSLNNEVILETKITDSNEILLLVISNDNSDQLAQLYYKDQSNINSIQIISKWIDHQYQVVEYNNKFSSLELTDKIIQDLDLSLFHYLASVCQQLQKVISEVKTIQVEQVDIEFYDKSVLTDKSRILKDILVKDLSVPLILSELGQYVIVKYKLDQDLVRIIFFVVLTNKISIDQQNTSIVEENDKTPLQTIISWFSDYPKTHPADYEIPHIKSYIDAFKPENLTAEIAETANLELFAPGKTVDWQIKYIIQKAKDEAQNKFKDSKEEFDDNDVFISIRKIGFIKTQFKISVNSEFSVIMTYMKGLVIINSAYDPNVDYEKLIFICHQNKE